MRLLFEIDAKNYNPNGRGLVRHSARCIALQNKKVAMIYSQKYDYYKFPGGGIEENETPEQAVIRETLEEAGLVVLPQSVKEFGYVHRIQRCDQGDYDYFLQDNFYYLCEVERQPARQILDGYEAEERFTLQWVEPTFAIDVNRNHHHGPKDFRMLERENRVLQILIDKGYFD